MARLGTAERGDGSTHIRPSSAILLSAIVWALCAATIVQGLWVYGASGLRFAELPTAVALVVWALLWAPRVIVRAHEIEVRNVLLVHRLPLAAIADVRLGAMLRFVVAPRSASTGTDADADAVVITAWNAPGVGKDRPRERLAAADPRSQAAGRGRSSVRSSGRGGRGGGRRATGPDWSQRLVEDQRSSPSYPALAAWQRWERAAGSDTAGADAAPGSDVGPAAVAASATQRVNVPVVVGLAAAAVLVVVHFAF
ncbi:hypothetical protein ACXET9_02470 [Brachybacterium sp. DNPG3]